jgi:hypothetical protein
MANWCNARLIVAGRRSAVLRFSRLARARPSALFEGDMLHGEGSDLFSERIKTLESGFAKKEYKFQIANDDGRSHFCRLSRKFPALCFVLVYFDANNPPSGSFFISRGRARSYEVPDELWEAILTKHGAFKDGSLVDDGDDWCYWEASWELMDVAEAHWQQAMEKQLAIRKRK